MPAERARRRRCGNPCPVIQLNKKERAMKTSTISILSVPLLAAGSIALSGCGRSTSAPTTITYHQVGICTGYQTQGTAEEKAGSNDGFAVFKIELIDNTKYGSLFYLDPERFYVNQSDAEQLKKNVYS
jgi:hypothetical protein